MQTTPYSQTTTVLARRTKVGAALALQAALAMILASCAALPGSASSSDGARWWKGNLHTHSLWSDGNDFPDMIVAWYREQSRDPTRPAAPRRV